MSARRFPAIDDLIAETAALCLRFAEVTDGVAWIAYDDPRTEGFVSTDPPPSRRPLRYVTPADYAPAPRKPRPCPTGPTLKTGAGKQTR